MLPQSELDLLRKASNQVWRLENVFSKCNYSFFLISTKGEYNLTLLTASGWNYSGCTGTGISGSSSVTKRRPVLFGNSIFPPNNEEIYQAYPGVSFQTLLRVYPHCRDVILLSLQEIVRQGSSLSMFVEKHLGTLMNQHILTIHSLYVIT